MEPAKEESLTSQPVFLAMFVALAVAYLLLKSRLARGRAHAPGATADGLHWVRVLESSSDPAELRPALEAVARNQDRRAVDALGRLLDHPSAQVSAGAANALGLIGDDRALGYLFASVGRLEQELGSLDAQGEGLDGGPASDEPEDEAEGDLVWPDRAQGRRLMGLHAKPGPEREGRLLALLALTSDPGVAADYRYFALKNLELLAASGPQSGPASPGELAGEIVKLLSDPDPSIRYASLGALEACSAPATIAYLEGATDDPNRYVRTRACLALAGLAPGRARKHLFALLSDPDEQVRQAARQSLDSMS